MFSGRFFRMFSVVFVAAAMLAGVFGVPIPAAANTPPPVGDIDAVVTHPNGKLYFFKTDEYKRGLRILAGCDGWE